ncbi:MAG: PLP-dependent aminotransferase family protein [Ktedonobacteraceae bacterium]
MATTHDAYKLGFPMSIDRAARSPLHMQLCEQLRQAILDGRLVSGTRLPSTRELAQTLGVSRTVTSSAYDELFAEGYLESRRGSGTYIGSDLPLLPCRLPYSVPHTPPRWLKRAPTVAHNEPIASHAIIFRLGTPCITSLPPRIWREAWRPVTHHQPPNDYGPLNGNPALRAALAPYLGRSRGLACTPEDIIITAGATHALDLIARATLSAGDSVGFEEPGYPAARHILLERGGHILPVPLDDDGMLVETLPSGPSAPLLVYTTPSHQYPLAARLSVARRMALLNWAETNDSLIVEDDYDSEFRFDASPLPALASFDKAGQVVYIGTFSKVLTPALRVGYLVAPPLLRERVEQLKNMTNEHPSWSVQQMLAALISDGHMERHIRRMRHQYAEKRQTLEKILAPLTPLAQLRGLEAGLHAYLELCSDIDANHVAQLAHAHDVIVTTLDAYYIGTPDRSGLLLGYASLDIPDIIQGAKVLGEVIKQVAALHPHS